MAPSISMASASLARSLSAPASGERAGMAASRAAAHRSARIGFMTGAPTSEIWCTRPPIPSEAVPAGDVLERASKSWCPPPGLYSGFADLEDVAAAGEEAAAGAAFYAVALLGAGAQVRP